MDRIRPMTVSRSMHAPEARVPVWLAVLVVALLVAVIAAITAAVLIDMRRSHMSPAGKAQVDLWLARAQSAPDNPAVHVGLGYAYVQAGRLSQGLREYDRALELSPGDPSALYNKGDVMLRLGRTADAVAAFREAIERAPTSELPAKALGDHYLSTGQWQPLLDSVKAAADAHPDLADLHFLVGRAYEGLGDPTQAAVYYNQALKFAPDLADAQAGLRRVEASR
jgi:tetratricopeptide (TPR) repeat protein